MNIIFNEPDIHISSLTEVADLFRSCSENDILEEDIEITTTPVGSGWESKAFVNRECRCQILADTKAYSAKLCLYKLLSERTGLSPAWGSLTGVKPLKLMVKLFEQKKSTEYARDYFKRNFEISDNKLALLFECARNQLPLLYPAENTYSLYIHVPLCLSKCSYCSFPSAVTSEGSDLCEEYLNALIKELRTVTALFPEKTADCIYVGGGTPSVFSTAQVKKLLEEINSLCPDAKELTYEAGRADTLGADKLEALKAGGVTRISLNPQTAKNETLCSINRRVSYSDFLRCFEMARKTGHSNINCDLIFGLDGEDRSDFFKSLSSIIGLSPESITLHTLCKKRTSEIDAKAHDRRSEPIASYMNEAGTVLKENGYLPYYLYRQKHALDNAENVGYAKSGSECIYNVRMMGERQSVLSAGAASTSKIYFPQEDRFENVYNIKNIRLYIDNIDNVIEKKINTIKKLTGL